MRILSLLPLLLLPPLAAAAADFCDADPRVLVHTNTCPPTSPPTLLLRLLALDKNPFHALHDALWAAAHYITNCATSYRRTGITLHLPTAYTPAACQDPSAPSPSWGHCAAAALAARFGARLATSGTLPPGSCFVKTVTLGAPPVSVTGVGRMRKGFRGASWFGRGCVPWPGGGCAPGKSANGGLVPLPERERAAAFAALRESVLRFAEVRLVRSGGARVRVLLYGRGDARRRRWSNAGRVYERLKNDRRVEVRFLRRTPRSFKAQVEAYAWADIVVAPHGAGMANTVAMRAGAEIIEVWKFCGENVAQDRFVPHDWTGWHAHLLGVNLQYVQCHRLEGPYKRAAGLLDGQHGVTTHSMQKVREEEVLDVFEESLARQRLRFAVTGRD